VLRSASANMCFLFCVFALLRAAKLQPIGGGVFSRRSSMAALKTTNQMLYKNHVTSHMVLLLLNASCESANSELNSATADADCRTR
jgi:hypothetical protein